MLTLLPIGRTYYRSYLLWLLLLGGLAVPTRQRHEPSVALEGALRYSPLTTFAHYLPLTTHCLLLTTVALEGALLTATNCSLLTAHCPFLTAHCSLLTAHCSLLTTHYSPLTTYHLLTTHCLLPSRSKAWAAAQGLAEAAAADAEEIAAMIAEESGGKG